jgi:hypothetical protein
MKLEVSREYPMRVVRLLVSLSLLSVSSVALGQNDPPEKFRGLYATYFETCMKDWERGTRMTKAEWRRTCRRLANQRVRFRLEHGFAPK